uniref:Uncharacterized protein n=1 Tax=Anguilla anguilla TaxID=7936 RepID=A0A0E9Y048_ANGAN
MLANATTSQTVSRMQCYLVATLQCS